MARVEPMLINNIINEIWNECQAAINQFIVDFETNSINPFMQQNITTISTFSNEDPAIAMLYLDEKIDELLNILRNPIIQIYQSTLYYQAVWNSNINHLADQVDQVANTMIDGLFNDIKTQKMQTFNAVMVANRRLAQLRRQSPLNPQEEINNLQLAIYRPEQNVFTRPYNGPQINQISTNQEEEKIPIMQNQQQTNYQFTKGKNNKCCYENKRPKSADHSNSRSNHWQNSQGNKQSALKSQENRFIS